MKRVPEIQPLHERAHLAAEHAGLQLVLHT